MVALHSRHEEGFSLELQGLGWEIWVSQDGITPIDFLWEVEAALQSA